MEDNVDIYDDIGDFDLGNEVERLKTENETLREHIRSLEGDIEKLTGIIVNLRENQETLKTNISTLYLTAKGEIDRKDRMISELRTQKDNICFRRFEPGTLNKRERGNNFSEGNEAKKFKYDDSNVCKTTIDVPKIKHESDSVELVEINKDIPEDSTSKTSKYEVDKSRKEQFDDRHHESYKSRSRRSREREREVNPLEDITANKFQYDNNRRREEYDDRYHIKHRSRSRPGNRYNNEYRSRSKSLERNEQYIEYRGSRYNNNFFRGERARMFGDREDWTDNRDTWRRHDRDFSPRDPRGEYSRNFDRAGNVKRETSPSYPDRRRSETYEKTKRDDKIETSREVEVDSKVSKDYTSSGSVHKHSTQRSMTENESTKTKPAKKRLKMLENAEKKIRKLRETPIKRNSSSLSEDTPIVINDHLKEVTRNVCQKFGNEKILKKSKKEDFRRNDRSNPKIKINKGDSSKKDIEDVEYIDISDEENSDKRSDDLDLIIIDETSNLAVEKNVNKKSNEYFLDLSEDDALTNAAIQDVDSTIKYHTEQVVPFQLSKDSSEFSSRDINLTKEHPNQQNLVVRTIQFTKEEKYINLCTNVNIDADNSASRENKGEKEGDDDSKANEEQNTNLNSCAGKSEAENLSQTKKKINILSNIDVTPPVNRKMRAFKKEIEVGDRLNIESANVVDSSKIRISSNFVACKKTKPEIEPKSSPNENNVDDDTKLIIEKDAIGDVDTCKNKDMKIIEKYSNASSSTKKDKIETKHQHKSLLKEFITNHTKRKIKFVVESQTTEENIKLSKQDINSMKVSAKKNSDTMDQKGTTKRKINSSNEDQTNNMQGNITVENIIEDKGSIIQLKIQDTDVNEKKEAKKPSLPTIIDEEEEKPVKNSKQQDIDKAKESSDGNLEVQSATKNKNEITKEETACTSCGNEELNELNKTGNKSKMKDDRKKNKALNVDLDTKSGKKESNKKIESTFQEDSVGDKKQDVNQSTKQDRKQPKKINSPKRSLTNTIHKDITVGHTNEGKESEARLKKQDIGVNEKEGANKIKKPSLPILMEEKKPVKTNQQKSSDVELEAQSATKNKRKITKEEITYAPIGNEELKEQSKNGGRPKKKEDINKSEALNADLDTGNATKGEKKESNKKINLSQENSTGGVESVDQSIKQNRKRSKSLAQEDSPGTAKHTKTTIDNSRKEEQKNVNHSKRRSSSASGSSPNVTSANDKKKELKKNSSPKEDLSSSSNQIKNLAMEGKIKDKNADADQLKKQNVHPFELSLNPELYSEKFTRSEKKNKNSAKEGSANATKRDIKNENIKDRQRNVIKAENQDVNALEKSNAKVSSANYEKEKKKECLPNVEDNAKEETESTKEIKKQASNKIEESSNMRIVAENTINDGEKESSGNPRKPEENYNTTHKSVNRNAKQPKKHKVEDSSTVNLVHRKEDYEKMVKSSPKDSTNIDKEDMGERKHTKKQKINRKSSVDSDVENPTRDPRKRKKSTSSENLASTFEDTEEAPKAIQKVSDSVQNAMEVVDKITSRDPLKEKVEKESVDIPNTSKKDEKNVENKIENKTCNISDNIHAGKESEGKIKPDETKTPAEENNDPILPNRAEGRKKNEEDAKDSADSANSEEAIDLRVMKFSDMRNILRASINESAVHGTTTKIGTKETQGTKEEPHNLVHEDKCSSRNTNKNTPKCVKNEKSRKVSESHDVTKSKNYTSGSSKSTSAVENVQARAKLIDEKILALVESCRKDSTVTNNGTVSRNSADRKSVNNGKNIVVRRICISQYIERSNCDKIENKSDSAKIEFEASSRDSHKSVNKNTQNVTPEKPQARRRITPTPVKANKPVCSFENILGQTSQSTFNQASPLHLTHEGEIPVLHLEDNHISNLPIGTNSNDKNLMSLLDTMNISNMDCDIPKITCGTTANSEENSADNHHINVSPITGTKSLTFENVISKVTSTPVVKDKCQNEKNCVSDSNATGSVVDDVTYVADKVSDSLTFNGTANADVQNSATIRRRRRRCRMVVID